MFVHFLLVVFFSLNICFHGVVITRHTQLGILLLSHLALERKYYSVLPPLYGHKNYFNATTCHLKAVKIYFTRPLKVNLYIWRRKCWGQRGLPFNTLDLHFTSSYPSPQIPWWKYRNDECFWK